VHQSPILVSSCLLGFPVRYDAKIKDPIQNLLTLYEQGLVIPCCPEVEGGLSIPRIPAEIVIKDGFDVIRADGVSVKDAFVKGANIALDLVKQHHIKIAILKSKSPSCSTKMIYDGTFSQNLVEGLGVTTTLLKAHGVTVFDEHEIEEALALFGLLKG